MTYSITTINHLHDVGMNEIADKMSNNDVSFYDKVKLFCGNLWRVKLLPCAGVTTLVTGATAVGLGGIVIPGPGWVVSASVGLGLTLLGAGLLIVAIGKAIDQTWDQLTQISEKGYQKLEQHLKSLNDDLVEVDLEKGHEITSNLTPVNQLPSLPEPSAPASQSISQGTSNPGSTAQSAGITGGINKVSVKDGRVTPDLLPELGDDPEVEQNGNMIVSNPPMSKASAPDVQPAPTTSSTNDTTQPKQALTSTEVYASFKDGLTDLRANKGLRSGDFETHRLDQQLPDSQTK